MFDRYIEVIERRAWWVIAAWVAAAVSFTLAAPSLNDVGSQDTADFLPADAPSQEADRILAQAFPGDPAREAAIIVAARDGGLTAADRSWITQLVGDLHGPTFADDIRGVQSTVDDPNLAPFLRSEDGAAELVIANMTRAPFSSTGTAAGERLRDRIAEAPPDGLEAHVTGIAGLAADQAEGVVESFDRTAIVTVLLVLVILVVIYRSAVAPLIPLLTIGLAFGVANGVVAYVADAGLKVNTMVGTFLVVMIFGAGTDYCLFFTSRYREDLADGDSVASTVRRTTKVIAPVIAASAATVIVGFLSMLTADFGVFKTMGPAIGLALAVTLAAGLTLTPALLRVAEEKAFWPRRFETIRATSDESSPRWTRVAEVVRRHPREVLLAGLIALQLPAAGLGWYRQSFDLVRDLPAGADARAGFDTVAAHYPGGTISPVYVIVTSDGPILEDARLDAIDHLTDTLRGMPGVAQVRSVTQPAGAPLTAENLASITGGATDPAALGIDPATTDVAPLMQAL
ncbi:MAG: MMPL family transporter, partial [Acidimicrobiia bacterium]